jgi:hypothetical protein
MELSSIFETLNIASIEEYISQRQEENLQLEFKTISRADLSSRDDRKNLASTMSAFANSGGGLIVWGVVAGKNSRGVDCANGRQEIAPLTQFISQVTKFAGDALSPRADGIRHRAIPVDGDSGFAVTLVPESVSGPHMAKLGEDRYYKRSGDSNYKMEHYDLEDMFGRRQRPLLQLRLERKPVELEYPKEELSFSILNIGKAVARHIGYFIRLPQGCEITAVYEGVINVSHLNEGLPTASFTNDDGVFHPNGVRYHVGQVRFIRPDQTTDITLAAKLYCDGMRAQDFTFPLPPLPAPQTQRSLGGDKDNNAGV